MTDILADGCKRIHSTHLMPGWSCCKCRCYNGLQRTLCRECGHAFCGHESRESIDLKGVPAPATSPRLSVGVPIKDDDDIGCEFVDDSACDTCKHHKVPQDKAAMSAVEPLLECLRCGTRLVGEKIAPEYRAKKTHWTKAVSVLSRRGSKIVAWKCPHCGADVTLGSQKP